MLSAQLFVSRNEDHGHELKQEKLLNVELIFDFFW